MDASKAAVKAQAIKESSERSESSEDWSEVEYGPGWEKAFYTPSATDLQMKAT